MLMAIALMLTPVVLFATIMIAAKVESKFLVVK